ncbi:MAG: FISUMP domain-containing protein [Synergistaceae bacterium]|jgi:uncharacterized protein (TIGR02145 family)
MKKIFLLLSMGLLLFSCGPQENPDPGIVFGSFTDSRDGHQYETVTIGSQVWMAENLAYLPSVSKPTSGSYSSPYYYVNFYNRTNVADAKITINYQTYGVLYNWTAAMNGAESSSSKPSGVQGACPSGWHLPSDAEWTQLETYLANNGYNYDGSIGGDDNRDKIAKSIASATGWDASGIEGAPGNTDYPAYINKSGFSALPGGYRAYSGFLSVGIIGFWWSSTESDTNDAWGRYLVYNYSDVDRSHYAKDYGFSVRCVRD